MRIISGKYKGRIIKMPQDIRPTQDKVRKALFDILGEIDSLSFLELFAGSGAIGIEAVSRGAKKVVFVEHNPICVRILKNNFSYLLPPTSYLLPLKVSTAVEKLSKDKAIFDIIFMDPPYYKDLALRLRSGPMMSRVESLAKKTLQILSGYDILTPNGFIIVQHFKKDNLPVTAGDLTLFKQARYGDTVLSFYRKVTISQSSMKITEHREEKNEKISSVICTL